jgi:hypothetical protein
MEIFIFVKSVHKLDDIFAVLGVSVYEECFIRIEKNTVEILQSDKSGNSSEAYK